MPRPTTLYRILTAPDDASFCHKVSEALSKGWMLYGPPTMSFDSAKGVMICGQAVTKDVEGLTYSPAIKLGAQ